MNRKKLFNPNATENIKMINGDTTNLLDLSFVPKDYEIFHKLVDTGYSNNWLPQKTDMSSDKYDYNNKLTPDEKSGFNDITSFLIFLDSIQTNNLPNLANFITSPHVVYFLARQTYEEANHSKSYGWILSSIMSRDEAHDLVYRWKENKTLLERNEFIAGIYQEFINNSTPETFLYSIVANYLLEGVYFYNGFQFFHNLASRGLITGTDTQISYIQRDELTHCLAFEHIIHLTLKENPELLEFSDNVYQMFTKAVEWEIRFSQEVIGDKILGMSSKSIEDYTYHLANKRLKAIGMNEIFPKNKNPYVHLEKQAGSDDETSNRTNNFEATSITYKSPEVISGWDEI